MKLRPTRWTAAKLLIFCTLFAAFAWQTVELLPRVPRATLQSNLPLASIGFTPDGKYFLTAIGLKDESWPWMYDFPVSIWDSETGSFVRMIPTPDPNTIVGNSVMISPDSQFLEITSGANLRVFRISAAEQIGLVNAQDRMKLYFSFSPDSRYFDVISPAMQKRYDLSENFSDIWHRERSGLICGGVRGERDRFLPMEVPLKNGNDFTYAKDGLSLFVAPHDAVEQFLEISPSAATLKPRNHFTNPHFSLDGGSWTCTDEHGVQKSEPVYPVVSTTWRVKNIPDAEREHFSGTCYFSKGRQRICCAYFDSDAELEKYKISFFDISDGQPRKSFEWPGTECAFSENFEAILRIEKVNEMAPSEYQLHFHRYEDAETKLLWTGNSARRERVIACSKDGRRAMLTEYGVSVSLDAWEEKWNSLAGFVNAHLHQTLLPRLRSARSAHTEIWNLEGNDHVSLKGNYGLGFSPNGKVLATQNENYEISLWDSMPKRNWPFALLISLLPSLLATLTASGLLRLARWIARGTILKRQQPTDSPRNRIADE